MKDDVKTHLTLKDYPESMRPREKMLKHGSESLSDQEILAVLLRTGTANLSALELAEELLCQNGFAGLIDASFEELSKVKGIGLAKASQIKGAVEMARRIAKHTTDMKAIIRCPEDIFRLLKDEMRFLDREYFRIVLLNTKNQVISIEDVSIGSLNSSIVHPREVFKLPIKRSAATIILVHNHPSGDPTPSREDVAITKRLIEGGKILGIDILDHIVIGNQRFVSIKEQGLI